jgi:hypothetical protein
MSTKIDARIPHWAVATTKVLAPGAQLCTRDGRKVGNAVVTGPEIEMHGHKFWPVLTDAGNVMHLNTAELDELFWPPKLLVDPATAPGVGKKPTTPTAPVRLPADDTEGGAA